MKESSAFHFPGHYQFAQTRVVSNNWISSHISLVLLFLRKHKQDREELPQKQETPKTA